MRRERRVHGEQSGDHLGPVAVEERGPQGGGATDRGHRPSARAGHTACVHEANGKGLKMLVFGGVARGDRHLESTLHELHVGADWSWRKVLASGPQPDARAYHTCTMLGAERVLVFGGNDAAHSFEQLHLLELASMSWSLPATRGTPPSPRTGHAALCLDGRRLLIHGGPRPNGRRPITLPLPLPLPHTPTPNPTPNPNPNQAAGTRGPAVTSPRSGTTSSCSTRRRGAGRGRRCTARRRRRARATPSWRAAARSTSSAGWARRTC